MTRSCGCGCQAHADRGSETVQKGSGPLDAEWTVGDVLHHYPGTGSIMKDMGVDHCCGAHLTLREAGAAAGVPLPALLEALNRRALAPA